MFFVLTYDFASYFLESQVSFGGALAVLLLYLLSMLFLSASQFSSRVSVFLAFCPLFRFRHFWFVLFLGVWGVRATRFRFGPSVISRPRLVAEIV